MTKKIACSFLIWTLFSLPFFAFAKENPTNVFIQKIQRFKKGFNNSQFVKISSSDIKRLFELNSKDFEGDALYFEIYNLKGKVIYRSTDHLVKLPIDPAIPEIYWLKIDNSTFLMDPEDCMVTTENDDFEQPSITGVYPTFLNQTYVPGWNTTASDGQIEMWNDPNYQNVPAYSGSQFVELNANVVSGLYQDYDTPAGTIFNYGFAHRGRMGTDTCQLMAGPPGGPYVNVGPPVSTGNSSWSYNTGTYTVPAGQPTTRFIFQSVSSVGGASVGNFLDAITFTANVGILTEGPLEVFCVDEISLESIGGGTWIEDPNNPSSTNISDVNGNDITISGFTTPGEYIYEWSSIYCTSTISIIFSQDDVEEPIADDVFYCQGSTPDSLEITPLEDHTILWFEDADGTLPLADTPTIDTNIVGETTYYVSQENSNGCMSDLVPLTVTIYTAPIINPVEDIIQCDDESNDGIADFDLESQTSNILGAQNPSDFLVTYYTSFENADAETGNLTSLYTVTSSPQPIWVRIEPTDPNSECISISPDPVFYLIIEPFADTSFTVDPTCEGAVVTLTGEPGGTFSFGDPQPPVAVIDPTTGEVTGASPSEEITIIYALD
ncbi:hypothetical protein GZ212_15030, partial [Mangrovimonas sp. CR14]|nr:hypothetical protein [Mangrovimonas sp. CR14]